MTAQPTHDSTPQKIPPRPTHTNTPTRVRFAPAIPISPTSTHQPTTITSNSPTNNDSTTIQMTAQPTHDTKTVTSNSPVTHDSTPMTITTQPTHEHATITSNTPATQHSYTPISITPKPTHDSITTTTITNDVITQDSANNIKDQLDDTADSTIIIQMELQTEPTGESPTTQSDNITTENTTQAVPDVVVMQEQKDEDKEKKGKRKITSKIGHLFSKMAKTGVLTRSKKEKAEVKKKNKEDKEMEKQRQALWALNSAEKRNLKADDNTDLPKITHMIDGSPVVVSYGSNEEKEDENEQEEQEEQQREGEVAEREEAERVVAEGEVEIHEVIQDAEDDTQHQQTTQSIIKNYELRKKPYHLFTKEEKDYFQKNIKSTDFLFNIDRHPSHIYLDSNNDICDEIPQLHSPQTFITIFDKDQKESVLVKLDNDQGVVIVKELKQCDEHLLRSCANIMGNSYQVNDTMKGRKFSIGKKMEKKDLQDKGIAMIRNISAYEQKISQGKPPGRNPIANIKFDRFTIDCNCCKVLADRTSHPFDLSMIACSKCKDNYHEGCVEKPKGKKPFTCTPCNINVEGLKWAANPVSVINTCPIDNTLTHLAIRCEKSPKFKNFVRELQKHSDDQVKAFANSILYAQTNNSAASQWIWSNSIKQHDLKNKLITSIPDTIDLFHGTDESFYKYLGDLEEFLVIDKQPCNTCGDQTARSEHFVSIKLTTTPADYLVYETPLFTGNQVPCDKPHCTGTKNQEVNAQGKPLWIRVVNEGSLQGPDAFLDCEKDIVISGHRYQLGCIVLYDKDRRHFTSLQYINNEFIYYDGLLKTRGSQLRRVAKTDYIGPNIVVDHMLYVRTIDGQSI